MALESRIIFHKKTYSQITFYFESLTELKTAFKLSIKEKKWFINIYILLINLSKQIGFQNTIQATISNGGSGALP